MAKTTQIDVLENFRPLMADDPELIKEKNHFLLISGRIGGKTWALLQKMFINLCQYPNHDIQVLRANSSSMFESVFMEFKKFCFKHLPDKVYAKFKWRQTPPLLITSAWGNQIHFSGVGLGSKSGSNISRGKTTERPLSLIVIEETQEIFSGLTGSVDLLNHAKATFLRNLDDKIGKVIEAGNMERNLNAKFNVWTRQKEEDPSYTIIKTSYLDLQRENLLNRSTIRSIEIEKELNPKNYEYMYLGIPTGGNDLVYGSFMETRNVIPPIEIDKENTRFFKVKYPHLKSDGDIEFKEYEENIYRLFIGVDGASSRDTCAFMPIFNTNSNKLILKTGDILAHNPKKNGIIRNNIMAQKHVRKWFNNLKQKYSLYHLNPDNIVFVVDGHNIDLIENLRFEFGSEAIVYKFTRKDLIETSEKVNNAFTDNVLFIVEEGFTMLFEDEYVTPPSVLYNELQTVCWSEERPDKFNDSIPNDFTDGIRYPVAYYATPPHLLKNY